MVTKFLEYEKKNMHKSERIKWQEEDMMKVYRRHWKVCYLLQSSNIYKPITEQKIKLNGNNEELII